ncbi:MAG: DUF952 domain-containing protein [Chloroflexi bacterium]|nr:DUF952 domain-containing protein [Chloroflexota bacterium]
MSTSASPEEAAPTTFHLTSASWWEAADPSLDYVPEPFEREGFIHCTDGEANLVATANRYYREVRGAFVALEIDRAVVRAPILYEDAARIYPHVYGSLNRDAVLRVRAVQRAADGSFLAVSRD